MPAKTEKKKKGAAAATLPAGEELQAKLREVGLALKTMAAADTPGAARFYEILRMCGSNVTVRARNLRNVTGATDHLSQQSVRKGNVWHVHLKAKVNGKTRVRNLIVDQHWVLPFVHHTELLKLSRSTNIEEKIEIFNGSVPYLLRLGQHLGDIYRRKRRR